VRKKNQKHRGEAPAKKTRDKAAGLKKNNGQKKKGKGKIKARLYKSSRLQRAKSQDRKNRVSGGD